jgi:hypothetical protein
MVRIAAVGTSSSSISSRSTCSLGEPLVSSNTTSLETSTKPDDLLKTLYAFVLVKPFYSFGSKFGMSTFLYQNVAFAPKYMKVRYIGFVIGKEFVGGLLEETM